MLTDDESYAKEIAFYIHNPLLKDKIRLLIENFNPKEVYKMTSTPNLLLWQVYKYIQDNIPEIN